MVAGDWVVDDCIEAGVQGLVMITAGFAETGGEGEERQRRLLAQVREAGLRPPPDRSSAEPTAHRPESPLIG